MGSNLLYNNLCMGVYFWKLNPLLLVGLGLPLTKKHAKSLWRSGLSTKYFEHGTLEIPCIDTMFDFIIYGLYFFIFWSFLPHWGQLMTSSVVGGNICPWICLFSVHCMAPVQLFLLFMKHRRAQKFAQVSLHWDNTQLCWLMLRIHYAIVKGLLTTYIYKPGQENNLPESRIEKNPYLYM